MLALGCGLLGDLDHERHVSGELHRPAFRREPVRGHLERVRARGKRERERTVICGRCELAAEGDHRAHDRLLCRAIELFAYPAGGAESVPTSMRSKSAKVE